MKIRSLLLVLLATLLVLLYTVLAGCGVETPGEEAAPIEEPQEELTEPETCRSEGDYVWTDTGELEDWSIRITIPKQLGCLKVDASKANLSLDEMLELKELNTSDYTPTREVINFCVAEVEGECAYREFDLPLLIEVKDYESTDEILL